MKRILKRITLEDKIDEWLKYSEKTVKISTYSYYCTVVNKHIRNKIGFIKVKKINENILDNYIKSLIIEEDIKDSTLRQIVIILKQIFKYSKIDIEIKLPKVKKRKIKILSESDKKRIEKYLFNNINEESIGILLSMHLGLRIGEVCALRWENIDLINGYIHIENTVERVKNIYHEGEKKTRLIVIKAKTDNSIRTLPLNSKLIKILTDFKGNKKDEYFLLTSSKKIADPRNYYNHYKNILKKHNVKNNYHSLRHTFATECMDWGLNPKALSEILGHSDIKTTLSLYVHPSINKTRDFLNDYF